MDVKINLLVPTFLFSCFLEMRDVTCNLPVVGVILEVELLVFLVFAVDQLYEVLVIVLQVFYFQQQTPLIALTVNSV